jgi:hypothetical protein
MKTPIIQRAVSAARIVYYEIFEDRPLWCWPVLGAMLILIGIAIAVFWIAFWVLEHIGCGRP